MFDLILDSVEDFHTVEERRLHRIFGGLELFGFYLYFIVDEFPEDEVIRYGMILGPLACGLLVLFMLAKVELAITNKRVYGRASFGWRVDLPLDSVTAIGTSFMKGIAITTASGSIKFRNFLI